MQPKSRQTESRRSVLAKGVALSLLTNTALRANDSSNLEAACVKVDITPTKSQWLHGYAPRQSNGVRDRIYHRVMALRVHGQEFYLVSTDVCTISTIFYNAFRDRLSSETGIPEDRFWWSTTHTHSAPHLGPQELSQLFQKTLGDRFGIEHDHNYWESVQESLITAIVDVRSRLKPATMRIAVGDAQANVNRRQKNPDGQIVLGMNPTGPVDRELNIIGIHDLNEMPIGLIANYAIHGTAFNGSNQKISGDVTGIVSNYVEASLGVPMLFINGAEGNIAPLFSVGGEVQSPILQKYIGLLGDPILELAKRATPVQELELAVSASTIESPRNELLRWHESLDPYLSEPMDRKKFVRLPIYTLRLNKETVIWAAPVELFSEISMKIRELSPFKNTFYFGLTNGSFLYVPTASAFEEGGYEPNVSIFTPAIEDRLTEGVIEHLRSLKS